MRAAVDTHALLWFLRGSALLSADSRLALREAQGSDGIVVSTAILVDLWYVTQTTRAFTTRDLDEVQGLIADESTAVDLVSIGMDVFEAWRRLERRVLPDPWDRFIVATAVTEGVSLSHQGRGDPAFRLRGGGLVAARPSHAACWVVSRAGLQS